MSEELKQEPYRIDLMRTLWENTYRGTIFNYKEEYVATVRLILGAETNLIPNISKES